MCGKGGVFSLGGRFGVGSTLVLECIIYLLINLDYYMVCACSAIKVSPKFNPLTIYHHSIGSNQIKLLPIGLELSHSVKDLTYISSLVPVVLGL